jgi:hypothetical protein
VPGASNVTLWFASDQNVAFARRPAFNETASMAAPVANTLRHRSATSPVDARVALGRYATHDPPRGISPIAQGAIASPPERVDAVALGVKDGVVRRAAPVVNLAIATVALLVAGCGAREDDPGPAGTTVNRQASTSQPCEVRQAAAMSSGWSQKGRRLGCLKLPRRLVPAQSTPAGWNIGGGRFLLVGDIGPQRSQGYAIWRRDGRDWRRMHSEDGVDGGYEVGLGDVTEDGRTDVLLENAHGSGGCGDRIVLGVGPTEVTELFRRSTCELNARLQDGLLLFREPVGPCRPVHAHCWAGVRLTVRGWSGRRVVVDRTVLSCRRGSLTQRRGCRPAPAWHVDGR